MKNILLKIFLLITLLFNFNSLYAGSIDFNKAGEADDRIKEVSIEEKNGDMEDQIKDTTENVFRTIKVVIGGLLVIYLVYAGVVMIFSMGNEDKLSGAKKSVWYAILGLLFINIPGTLYDSFSGKNTTDDITADAGNLSGVYERNIFMNSDVFGDTLGSLITFLQIGIVAIAVFIIVLSGIKIMLSAGEEEKVKEAKNKIIWSVFGLIFLGIMEVWKNVVFIGDLAGKGKDLFSKLANLALFFAGPIAIFFISLAGYYYITSAGEEEKIKKAKSILINTVFATLILLGIYTFLLDLKDLSF